MKNDFETFENILIENDFDIQEKAKPNIPKGTDAKTELGLHKLAIIEMGEANSKTAKSVAAENYDLLEELTELYLNASNHDQEKIREFLKNIKRWREVFLKWWPRKSLMTENPEQYLKILLAHFSMLDGGADYRDTIMSLTPRWQIMVELGIDPEPIFRKALTWGGGLETPINNVLNRYRR